MTSCYGLYQLTGSADADTNLFLCAVLCPTPTAVEGRLKETQRLQIKHVHRLTPAVCYCMYFLFRKHIVKCAKVGKAISILKFYTFIYYGIHFGFQIRICSLSTCV